MEDRQAAALGTAAYDDFRQSLQAVVDSLTAETAKRQWVRVMGRGRGQVHLSVSTWRQPLPPAASRASRRARARGRAHPGVWAVHRDRYQVAERLYVEEVDPIRLVDVVIDSSMFDPRGSCRVIRASS
jgi:hypothetical protein